MAQVATITPLNQYFSLNGSPLNNGKLYFGEVNKDPEQFPVTVYWDEAGTVPALQPIRTTSGYPSRNGSPAILYVDDIYSMRVRQSNDVQVYYIASTGTPPPIEPTPFVDTDLVPSYASANSFTLTGDQTAAFQPGRRAQMTLGSGFVYGTITAAVYGALTTVTLAMDSTPLDASLSAVALSFFTVTPNALPPTLEYVNPQTGTTYTYVAGDQGKLVTHTNAAAIAGTLPIASSLPNGWWADIQNVGAGALTITPTTSTINGVAALVLRAGQGVHIVGDGSNYFTLPPSQPTIATSQATTSGTSFNFTGIPSWATEIYLVLATSQSGTSDFLVRLGTLSGGVETSGYESSAEFGGTGATSTTGFIVRCAGASTTHYGTVSIRKINGNRWISSGVVRPPSTGTSGTSAGSISMPGVVDRLNFTNAGGSAYNGGLINIFIR